jgi:hypothetical protein
MVSIVLTDGQLSAVVAAIKVKSVLSGKWIERAEVAAVKEISVLTGHRIERREVGAPGEFETMTDDELERALIERIARLGLTDVGETQH